MTFERRARLLASCLLGAAAFSWSSVGWCDASIPWMPSERARHRLELLADEAGLDLSLTQWPLPSKAVTSALDRLPASLSAPLEMARAQVRAEIRASEGAQTSVVLRNPSETLPGFGDVATPGSAFALASGTFDGGWAAGRLGLGVERGAPADHGAALRLEGTALAVEALGLQLQAWSHRSWWGPGWQSSLILSNNAPSLNAVSLQRASASRSTLPVLSWIGPWNFEFFVGRLEGDSDPAHPVLIGNRLTLRPLSWLEIGLTRTAQWGGHGRPQSFHSFVQALVGSKLNADTVQEEAVDPANELAGFDFRARCPFALRCAAYAQAIGEDMAGFLPSHYLGMYGIEAWSADGSQRWIMEYAEPGCRTPIGRPAMLGCAYRNYQYGEGYTQDGRWLGASVGPDSRLLTLGWVRVDSESSLRLHYGQVGSRIGSFSAVVGDRQTSGHVVAASGKQTFHWHGISLEPELSVLRIQAPAGVRYDRRLGLTLQSPLEVPR